MSKNQNKCIFTGRLGKDPESRTMPSGDLLVTFPLAVSDDFKDKGSGRIVEKTEWVNCKATSRLAEICLQYLKKGSRVFIEAKFETRKYQKEGRDVYVSEFLIREMEMMDARSPAPEGQPAGPRSRPMPATNRQAAPGDIDDMIPF